MNRAWKIGWKILVCVALLGWIFHAIFLNEARAAAGQRGVDWDRLPRAEQWSQAWTHGPHELWAQVSLIQTGPLLLSLLLMAMTIVLGVVRWRMVLRVHGFDLPWTRAAEISLVAHFFNSFLLGSTGGDLMKAYYAARETHHKKTEAVMTVFADRLIGLWAMLLFAGLMMVPNLSLLTAHHRLRVVALVVLAMLAACSALAFLAFRGGVSKGWSGARDWLRRLPQGERINRSLESCREFGRRPFFLTRTMAVSMALNAFCVLQILVLCRGLNIKVPILAMFLIVPIIICISAIPITPSGLGVRENLFVFLLAGPVMQVPPTLALALSLLAYAGSLFWSIVGGIVYVTFREKHHLTEKELEQTPSDVAGVAP
ncbi:MAG: flippase-like domain-containing protein [Verrucomicrobia subdivision 3 bacterium]|nr:flippase-like domain-containing protein [Limisphaerales bacterium]